MPKCKHILFIDETPIDTMMHDYFAHLNVELRQQKNIPFFFDDKEAPSALLIHWSILKKEPRHTLDNLYASCSVPLLIINDAPDEEACILVLESGADDFLTTPIHPRELYARINIIYKRINQSRTTYKNSLHFANWRLYPASRQVFSADNQELILSAGEFDLLHIFVKQPQRVINRESLIKVTKEAPNNPLNRRIDVQISRLRQKLEPDAKNPTLIKTVRNEGYMLTTPVLAGTA